MTKRLLRVGLVSLGVAAVAPLCWWMASALAEEVPNSGLQYADYLWDPPGLSGSERHAIGAVSLVLVVGGAIVLVEGLRSGRLRQDWLRVLLPLAGVAAYAGVTYSVATEPVIGANIGAGLMVLAGLVVVPTLLGFAVLSAVRLRPSAG